MCQNLNRNVCGVYCQIQARIPESNVISKPKRFPAPMTGSILGVYWMILIPAYFYTFDLAILVSKPSFYHVQAKQYNHSYYTFNFYWHQLSTNAPTQVYNIHLVHVHVQSLLHTVQMFINFNCVYYTNPSNDTNGVNTVLVILFVYLQGFFFRFFPGGEG